MGSQVVQARFELFMYLAFMFQILELQAQTTTHGLCGAGV